METIEEIRSKVFKHLRDRYYDEKNKGNEFFFSIEDTFPHGLYGFSISDRLLGIASITVLLYGNWNNAPIACIIIDENQSAFLLCALDSRSLFDYEAEMSVNRLKERVRDFSMYFKGLKHVDGRSTINSFSYVYELVYSKDYIINLDYFINKIKPTIDELIRPLKDSSKYNYFFFNQKQFDAFLAKESSNVSIASYSKENIRLNSLIVRDFKGIKQLVLSNFPETARWIVLTGENGYGKTSVLQAIAAGLYGNHDETGQQLVPDTSYIGVQYYLKGKEEPEEVNSESMGFEATQKRLKNYLACYGSSRLQVTAMVSNESFTTQAPPTQNLFQNGLLLNVEQLLKDTESRNPLFFSQLLSLFKALIPQLADIKIEIRNKLPEVLYVEKDENGEPLTSGLPFNQLAAGFRNIIAMVGDMVYRLSINQDITQLSDLEGIVIIDELELHLHPTYQKLFPKILSEQFPKLQFIVSTHSPIPLLGIPPDVDVVLLHVTRSEEEGINVEKLDVDFSVLTPNAILTSPIFGFKDLIPDSKDTQQMIQPEDTYQQVQENQTIKKTITSFLSEEKQQELLKYIRNS